MGLSRGRSPSIYADTELRPYLNYLTCLQREVLWLLPPINHQTSQSQGVKMRIFWQDLWALAAGILKVKLVWTWMDYYRERRKCGALQGIKTWDWVKPDYCVLVRYLTPTNKYLLVFVLGLGTKCLKLINISQVFTSLCLYGSAIPGTTHHLSIYVLQTPQNVLIVFRIHLFHQTSPSFVK